ncbi:MULTISPECIES: DUF4349 domain-containing protein [unclassified Flavobacterium]|uniref:DUF4349 domain-containing protein n=1 Tax=unclassified Flavobacterium TaxID=196869 RepID=UPI00086B7824|nr:MULTISPECIES: DUF4349 domain-containing protein [unclassified Flavobacterium]MBN9285409.1 DUF4349 domain-containing protein [Flavobacterium sp.]ODS85325.1 MAG: hypothetical protein ABS44_15380 [Chryseobacterium sp. SCN 40-13]OJV71689.1 MAG: hypothetical protein BGO42_12595 [Flavobacterium sp. 40-81]
MKRIIVALSLLLITIGCQKQRSEQIAATEYDAAPVAAAMAPSLQNESGGAGEETKIEAKIIKNANLRFETSDLNQSFSGVQKAIVKYKATIQNDVSGKDYGSVYRNLIVRIPNTAFDAFITDIGQGVSHFDRKEISSDDVTEEYIDVESRINTKKTLEKRYLELLNKATKVSEIIEIEKGLATVREEIEAKEGQLKYLQSRVAMSTVTIEMYTNNASESGATVSYGSKMWNSFKEGFFGISTFFLGLLQVWPFIIIFVLLFVFIRRRFKKKSV